MELEVNVTLKMIDLIVEQYRDLKTELNDFDSHAKGEYSITDYLFYALKEKLRDKVEERLQILERLTKIINENCKKEIEKK